MVAFRCYISAEGSNVIRQWYDGSPEELKGALDGLLDVLGLTPRKYWRLPGFRKLTGPCCGLCALRLKVEEVHHRVLGFDGPAADAFTLLHPFKKRDDPDYSKSGPIGHARKDQVIAYEHHSRECRFP
jgi:hypothetical protein